MAGNIFAKVDHYISSLVAPEDEALKNTISSLDEGGIPQISISPVQGKLLQVLMAACRAKRVLELGTLGGYSTIWMARALPADGRLITVEADVHHIQVAKKNIAIAGLDKIIEIKEGKAIDILQQMITANEPAFDFIFIDANKPPYKEYFDYAVQLSRPGTIIVCDNVIREGAVLDKRSTDENVVGAQRLNEALRHDERVIATIMQTVGVKEHDGMVMAVVK